MTTNEELKMTTNQPRSAGSRLWWIFRTTILIFIIFILIAAVLGGLGYGGYLGVQEIQRSNNSMVMRMEANEQNLDSLRDLVNAEFAEGNPEQQVQINGLENELSEVTTRLETLQVVSMEDATLQTDQIDTLEAELATAVAQNSNLSAELAMVQSALVALQGDLNSSVVRLDEVGGDVDRLRLQLGTLDTTLETLNAEAVVARDAETADVTQQIALLQLWGILTNARLSLIDGDTEFAETAVAQATNLAANLAAEPDSDADAALQRLQTRLSLATDGFATDLPMVAQDLEAASRELNLLMSGPSPDAEVVVEATLTPTEASEETTVAPTEAVEENGRCAYTNSSTKRNACANAYRHTVIKPPQPQIPMIYLVEGKQSDKSWESSKSAFYFFRNPTSNHP